MKRKKWSEVEEQTLLSKYSDLLRSGTLAKLKTREKKFKPVAEHVNAVHHHRDPSSFPFKWSWRDVSIKVQNMRHQYLGVKQKIRLAPHHFNWKDGNNHWENFLKYKEVFGDVQLLESPKPLTTAKLGFEEVGLRCGAEGGGGEARGEAAGAGVPAGEGGGGTGEEAARGGISAGAAAGVFGGTGDGVGGAAVEVGEGELEKRMRLERELDAERRWRKRVEEKMEEEEMEWRQRMVAMQVEHEKQMMQMHVEACQNQMQVLGIMARLLCQFFGSGTDGLSNGLGALPPQVLHHGGGLGDVKPDVNSPSEFI
ncbi:hypothetical protein ACSQ67_017347 [Phaseolus vulgaris]